MEAIIENLGHAWQEKCGHPIFTGDILTGMMASRSSRLLHRQHKRRSASTVLRACIVVLMLGGCTWSPFSTDKDKDKADGGRPDAAAELEHCTLKAGACNNSCYKAGAGAKCTDCCRRNAESCDNGEGYSFYSCPDEE